MIAVVADTHALIWALFNDPRLSLAARAAMDSATTAGDVIGISTITLVEIVYLQDKGKIAPDTLDRTMQTLGDPNGPLATIPLTSAIVEAMRTIPRATVPDMPDRIIAATAAHLGVPLISRDSKIRVSAVPTIW